MGNALAGPLVQQSAGGAVLAAIVGWEHPRGGQAHCLGRFLISSAGRPVGVLSELRSNPAGLGVTSGVAAAATALLRLSVAAEALDLPSPAEAVGAVAWVLHHGAFSSRDNPDAPETFTLAEDMHWEGSRYRDDIRGHRLLAAGEVAGLLGGAVLEPVAEVLARLGWRP